jgi:hypothetical protein
MITATIPDVAGHKFYGALVPWNGTKPASELVDQLIPKIKVPFSIDRKKDNVIFAALAVKNGQLECQNFDDKEFGASTRLLNQMARSKIGGLIIIIRQYGGFHLGSNRYLLFKQLAGKLLDGAAKQS